MGLFSKLRYRIKRRALRGRDPAEVFSDYVRINKWGDRESVSGKGSNLQSTEELRRLLPPLLAELGVRSMVDVPCGDFNWMAHVDLSGVDYLGGDIVPELIERNRTKHSRAGIAFEVIDLIAGPVPKADLVFCRDCLVHLSNAHVAAALANIRASDANWLLTTVYGGSPNDDIYTGEWRPIDISRPPFGLPAPRRLIAEGKDWLPGQAKDKMLGLWRVADIPAGAGQPAR